MTSVATSPQSITRPHVKVERSRVAAPTRENSRSTTVVSSTPKSPTLSAQKPSLPTNRRFSNVQSKVGSFDSITYKPKASEKKILSVKQDFSHIKSKVDAKLVLPPLEDQESAGDVQGEGTPATATATATADAGTTATKTPRTAPAKRPSVTTAGSKTNNTSGSAKALSPTSRTPSTVSSIRTAGAQSSRTTSVASGGSNSSTQPTHARRESISSTTSSVISPKSPTRRLSKHIIPTQKVQYDHVKSKVGSFDNVAYATRGRTGSQGSSADEGNGAISPSNGRSRSPSAMSSTSSTGATSPRRQTFKIPKSKKVDYSNVKSKVASLDNATHVPQGGNLRIFSEKLNFREQAQSKIQKEINIVQFYDYSVENSIQEEQEEGFEGEQDQSIIYSSDGDADEFEPPKNILSVLGEMTESVEGLDLEDHQPQEQQANDDSRQEIEAAL